ncbi:hypothetical protein [Nocardia africana]
MITRHDDGRRATYYGDAPLVDHAGYTVEVGHEDDSELMTLRVGLDGNVIHAIRADLPLPDVIELRERCDAFIHEHQEQK